MRAYLESVKDELQNYPPQRERPRKSVRGFVTVRDPITGASTRMTLTQAAELEGRRLRTRNEPSRRYERTNKLHDGWKVVVTPDGSNGFVVNNVKYAVFAQGPRGGGREKGARQTGFMRSLGWKSITDVARQKRKEFPTVMNKAIKGGK